MLVAGSLSIPNGSFLTAAAVLSIAHGFAGIPAGGPIGGSGAGRLVEIDSSSNALFTQSDCAYKTSRGPDCKFNVPWAPAGTHQAQCARIKVSKILPFRIFMIRCSFSRARAGGLDRYFLLFASSCFCAYACSSASRWIPAASLYFQSESISKTSLSSIGAFTGLACCRYWGSHLYLINLSKSITLDKAVRHNRFLEVLSRVQALFRFASCATYLPVVPHFPILLRLSCQGMPQLPSECIGRALDRPPAITDL